MTNAPTQALAEVPVRLCPRCGRDLWYDPGGEGSPAVWFCPKGICPYYEPDEEAKHDEVRQTR